MGRVKVVTVAKKHRQFDQPYLLTISAEDGGWVRYQTMPACIGQGHRVNFVHSQVRINDKTNIKIWEGLFHCINCKLMGTVHTMKEYSCS